MTAICSPRIVLAAAFAAGAGIGYFAAVERRGPPDDSTSDLARQLQHTPVPRGVRSRGSVVTSTAGTFHERLKYVLSLTDRTSREAVLAELFADWARTDVTEARAALTSLARGSDRRAAVAGLARGWLALDFRAAANWIRSLPPGGDRDRADSVLLEVWGERDNAGAIAFATQLPPGARQTAFFDRLAAGWAQSDPAAASAWAARLTDPRLREVTLRESLATWVQRDPVAAMTYARQLNPPLPNTGRLIEAWAESDPRGASAYVSSNGWSNDPQAVSAIACAWVHGDPRGLQAWLATTNLSPSEMGHVVADVLVPAMEGDPSSGLVLLQLAPAGANPDLYAHAAEKLTDADPALAKQWIATIAQPENQRAAVETFAAKWSANDAPSAAAWALTLPSQLHAAALQQVVANWSTYDPLEAANFVLNRLSADEQITYAPTVMRNWAQQDPATVADFVRAFPEGDVRNNLIGSVVETWAARDSAATEAWIKALPAGDPVRGRAVEPLYQSLINTSPRQAIQLELELGNPGDPTTQQRLAYAAVRWYADDPTEATEWLRSTTAVAENVKAPFLAQIAAH